MKKSLFIIQNLTKLLEKISPKIAGLWANYLFFRPRKKKSNVNANKQLINRKTKAIEMKSTYGKKTTCHIYLSGTGPTVLMIHGWEGSASNFFEMGNKIVKSGYSVVMVDFPAHGNSQGNSTNLDEFQRLISLVSNEINSLVAIVAHSFGAFATAYAIKQRVDVEKFIAISSPVDMDFIVNSFTQMIGASETSKHQIIAKIESILNVPYHFASIKNNTVIKKCKGLIIHDKNDPVVPYEHAQKLARLWPKASSLTTENLGHYRILKDVNVIKEIITYLDQ